VGKLSEAIAALDKKGVLAAVQAELDANVDPLAIVEEARQGLEQVGKEYDAGRYFLMELLRAAQIFKDALKLLGPALKERYGATTTRGTVVIGTVKGDVHDLGKGIVRDLLECNGIRVVDLGVDVAPQAFVDAIKEHKPQVVAMSALLTAAITQIEETVQAIQAAGLRNQVKVIVGGGIVGEVRQALAGVDCASINANEGVAIIQGWIGGQA